MGAAIQKQIPLAEWTGWKVGGQAEYFALPRNLEELKSAWQFAKDHSLSITPLSGGTNSLVSDRGIKGLVIGLKKLNAVEVQKTEKEIQITALAGAPKYELVKIFSQYQLAPALFLCGLPGDVGGGVVMNAGVSQPIIPHEFCEIVKWVKVFSYQDGCLKLFQKEDLKWDYRLCSGWGEGIIFSAGLSWPLEPLGDFREKLRQINRKRTSSQPLNWSSCGSVFKNPLNERAGRLIEQAGLKGYAIGGAEVSTKHANFIVNKNEAKANDIHRLICHVRDTVKQKTNIVLETEIHYLGDWD